MGTEEPRGADPLLLDAQAVRRAFGRAAATYDEAAGLQREVGKRVAARLDYVKLAPRRILDVGCGTGLLTRALTARYAAAAVTGIDFALPMLTQAEGAHPRASGLLRLMRPAPARPHYACADVRALPFAAGCFDLIVSNLMLQWVDELAAALAELQRVLAVGGLLTFTTLGPDTLRDLRAAFADGRPHVNRFVDMHDIGDALVAAGFADPVVDMSAITLTYATPRALLAELKALGATNAAAGRARGLLGRAAYRRLEAGLEAARRDGRIPATFEVIHAQAWKAAPRTLADGRAIVRFRERP
jgi:malonyl-CoA O-methyltransferase